MAGFQTWHSAYEFLVGVAIQGAVPSYVMLLISIVSPEFTYKPRCRQIQALTPPPLNLGSCSIHNVIRLTDQSWGRSSRELKTLLSSYPQNDAFHFPGSGLPSSLISMGDPFVSLRVRNGVRHSLNILITSPQSFSTALLSLISTNGRT